MTDYTELNERQTIYLQRVSKQVLSDYIYKAINSSYRQVRAELIDFESITNQRDLNKLTAEIRRIIKAEMLPAWDSVAENYNEVAIAQAEFSANAVMSTQTVLLSIPADEQIKRAVNNSIMSLTSGSKTTAGTWQQFIDANTDNMAQAYNSVVIDAYQKGRINSEAAPTVSQISQQLRQLNENLIKNNADAIARTGVVHYANQGQSYMARQNSDVIEKEYPIVTFDNRVSNTCISIDAKYSDGWLISKSPIGYPPYHYQCRTAIGYLTKGQKKPEGDRVSIGGQKGKEAQEAFNGRKDRLRTASQVRYRGRKDSNVFKPELINADTPVAAFLRSQPRWFVDDTLGKTAGDLFLSGKLKLKDLTDDNLRPLSVAELKLKAGL